MGRICFPDIFIKIKLLFSQRFSKWCKTEKGCKRLGGELKGACLLFSWKTKAKERHQAKERTMLAGSSKSSPQAFIQLVASFDISEDFDVRKDCRAVSSLMSSVVGLDVLGHLFQPWRFCFYMYDHLEEISHFGCLFSQSFQINVDFQHL